MKKSLPMLAALIGSALLPVLSGCDRSPDLVTQAAGHSISARITGPHSVETETDHAVISGPYGKVTIERSQVKVNGGRWTAIPEGVPVILEMARSKLHIRAGNVTISHSTR